MFKICCYIYQIRSEVIKYLKNSKSGASFHMIFLIINWMTPYLSRNDHFLHSYSRRYEYKEVKKLCFTDKYGNVTLILRSKYVFIIYRIRLSLFNVLKRAIIDIRIIRIFFKAFKIMKIRLLLILYSWNYLWLFTHKTCLKIVSNVRIDSRLLSFNSGFKNM